MKKSSFVALIMGTVSGLLFSLGMCMALLPEWDAFVEGVIFGSVGLIMGLITLFVWRKMEKKPPLKLSAKNVLTTIVIIGGLLLLGVGMSFCMVWENIVAGTLIGIAGIAVLLCLIPLIKGLK